MKDMHSIGRAFCAMIALAACFALHGYTINGSTASFGTVKFPATFSGKVTTAVASSTGVWSTFTFTAPSSGKQPFKVDTSLLFGSKHTVRTQLFKGTVSKVATINNSGSTTVNFVKGQYYTVKVQIISPSYYTTTQYSYTVTAGNGSNNGSGDLTPPTPTASQGTYKYVKLTWTKVAGAKGYIIKRGTSSSYAKATQLKKITKGGTKSFNDTSAKKGTVYYYWVCPYDAETTYYDKTSYASGYVKGTILDVKGAYISGSTKVTFKANSTVTGYYLYVDGKKITKGVKWTKSGSVKLSTSGGGARLKMTTRPSGSYIVVYLTATYEGIKFKKSVYIYK